MILRRIRRFGSALATLARALSATSPPQNQKETLKSLLMEEAARARNLPVTRLDARRILVHTTGGAIPFEDMNGPASSVVGRTLCDQKHLTRTLLERNDVRVTPGSVVSSLEEAIAFVRTVGYPVVVKPVDQARGRGVTTDVSTERVLRRALLRARIGRRPVLVEGQFPGDDYRFFVVDGEVVSVSRRVPAHVIGDGTSSVRTLIARKNERRRENRYLRTHLIPMDPGELTALARTGRSLSYVPAAYEHVRLRDQSNLSAGGDSVDVTDACHESFINLAIRAVATVPGTAYAGVDVLAMDIGTPATADNHVVSEVEFSPGPVSQFPVSGAPRDMAAAVLSYYLRRARPTR